MCWAEEMRCILHAGAHKTGSTAIQEALSGFDDGVTCYADLGHPNHSFALQGAFSEDDEFSDHLIRAGVQIDLKTHVKGDINRILKLDRDRIIFSAENLSIIDYNTLERLRDYILKRCTDINVIYFVRDPLDWTCSFIQAHVNLGSKMCDIRVPNFSEQIVKIQDIFGEKNVKVLSYEAEKKCYNDIVPAYCDLVGIDPGRIKRPRSYVNKALSADAFATISRLNELEMAILNEPQLQPTYRRFIRIIKRLSRDRKALDPISFSAYCNFEDYEFLSDTFDIQYSNLVSDEIIDNSNHAKVSQEFTDIMFGFIEGKGINLTRANTDSIIKSIYLYSFCREFNH
ncbi:MAG: hypothetical protein AAGG56_03600 [Pseudomonadota bacterium]